MLDDVRIGLKVDVDTLRGTREGVPRLAALLKKHGVEAICDVRSVPYSQHNPQFNREPLKKRQRALSITHIVEEIPSADEVMESL